MDASVNGLDRFGQVKDLHYRNAESSPRTLFRGEYWYDKPGNRTAQRITQALGTGGGAAQVNFRSQVHQYDALQRLIKSEMGTAAPLTGEPTEIVSSQPFRKDQWGLDHLGNWIGGEAGAPTGRSAIGEPINWGSSLRQFAWDHWNPLGLRASSRRF